MRDAVSSDFVSRGLWSQLGGVLGQRFPTAQWKGSRCLLPVPKSQKLRVRTQLLHASHSTLDTINLSHAIHSHPPHWLWSALLGMGSSFCLRDKLLVIVEGPPLPDFCFTLLIQQ